MNDPRFAHEAGPQSGPQAGPQAAPEAPAFGREFGRETDFAAIGPESNGQFTPGFNGPLVPGGNGPRTALVGDDHGPPPSPPGNRRPEPWRIAGAVSIVALVVAAIWLWGRPSGPPPTVLAARATESWLAGQPVGAFELVSVPAELGEQFADIEAIPGAIAAVAVPSGSFVTPGLLERPGQATGALTVMRFDADTSAWPEPGPRAGSYAVVAPALGGCAMAVTTLAGGSEGTIDVEVDAADAALYASTAQLDGLVVWPAPPQGWPACRPATPDTPDAGLDLMLFESGPPAAGLPDGADPAHSGQAGS